MASVLSLTLFLSLTHLLVFSMGRELQSHPTPTTTLNVAASLQATRHVFSLSSTAEQQEQAELESAGEEEGSSKSLLTVRLHPREAVKPSGHEDYAALTAARLRRDAARVRGISARVALAAKGVKHSEMEPLIEEDEEASEAASGIEGPVVSGMQQGSGEYFSRVGIGQPAHEQYMVLDTGSDVSWVQCEPCSDCYDQADPVFNPTSSSSYRAVGCDSSVCRSLDVSACRNNSTCMYQVSYGDGSYTVGDFATETLTLGQSAPVRNIALGCGHDNEGLFVAAAGLLGLGQGALSFPSQLGSHTFSYCLVDRDSSSSSTLQFGGDPAGTVTAPLMHNRRMNTFYYIGLSGIGVGGSVLSIPPSSFQMDEGGDGGTIVDSGTAITRLQSQAYTTLRDAFVKGAQALPRTSGVSLFDTCYDLSGRASVDVPTVSLHFPEGQALVLPAKNYLVPVDSTGTFCFAFAPTNSQLSIIGNVQQQGTRVAFDTANSVVSFTPNKC
ncbi:hypothetical protein AMTRI_Chr12g268640 [Amborella trichopoda]|uniref:Peptidase A1 domain-containing protein n=1 Tax=Amborella trichopoda TaxID=13333 RepID=W1PBW8_AMBTC|nr:protein ASPARTIC PROTEASE IN GUARD CELL 1 [Amborella trichopoda]ERN05443.1 hypothetical protein AMTR_s00007p00241440 [Amborella trichopoda]|eukprot:XP_006843768.1 protein ASPARTIC PROTEASE IN GUARD CELL 1 [Amborella trichopoda]